jgi:hypothetical protein
VHGHDILTLVVDSSSGYAKSSRLVKPLQVLSSANYVAGVLKNIETWFMKLLMVTSERFDVT